MRRFVLLAALSTVFACGKDSGGMQTGDDSPPADSAQPGSDGPDLAGTSYSITWGPINVDAHDENTQCIRVKLTNPGEIKVNQIHNVLGATSHHLIVYRDDDPNDQTEQMTPYDCQPFTGALNTSGNVFPMVITQKHDDLLTLPTGVAYTLPANQMIKIEMHYINTTDDASTATATVNVIAAEPSTITDEANILFIGTPDVNLPPNANTTVHEFFSAQTAGLDTSNMNFFAMTGHTHKLGLDVKVGTAAGATDPITSVYAPDPFLWSEPVTQTYTPEFKVPTTGGFDFQCDYYNDSSATVRFGESANDEMCFFWAYYYPSSGSHVCIHTNQVGGGADVCCPDDSSICSLIAQQF
ncbi:MAG TPA: hypothetical protein VGM88_06155 [Kofleriaceae bacterium]